MRDLTKVMGYLYKITSPNGKIYIGQAIARKDKVSLLWLSRR